jgi:hypothetical protein
MKKLMYLMMFALGYVLGAQAGRQRYEQIMGALDHVRTNPKVRATAQQAVDTAKQQAPGMAEKVTSAASAAASKVTRSSSSDDDTSSDANQHAVPHMAGPQGDLP